MIERWIGRWRLDACCGDEGVDRPLEALPEEPVSSCQRDVEVGAQMDAGAVDALQPSEERSPVATDPPQVRLVAAAVARQLGCGAQASAGVRQLVRRRQRDADAFAILGHTPEPVEDVTAAITARYPAGRTDAQEDLSTCTQQLLGELDPGLARTHEQHATGRQFALMRVVVCVEAQDPGRQGRRHGRDSRCVETAGGDDDRLSADPSLGGLDHEPAIDGSESLDTRVEHDRGPDGSGVAGHAGDDLVAGHEGITVVAVIGVSGERGRPVGPDQPERVPAVLPASAECRASFEQHVLATRLLQVPAHREPGLPGADDDGLDPGGQGDRQVDSLLGLRTR